MHFPPHSLGTSLARHRFGSAVLLTFRLVVLLISLLAFARGAAAQTAGGLRGEVLDPNGAVVPGASVTLTRGSDVRQAQSGPDG
jgi:hypothetical protein